MTFNYANGAISVPGVANLMQSIISGQRMPTASPFNVNVGSSSGQGQIHYQPMVGILDDTPQYAKDISSGIKNIQENSNKNNKSGGNQSTGSDDGDGKTQEGTKTIDISGASLPGFIMSDQRLNAVIIRDRRENMPFYEEIISKLDVPCDVIKVDVSIVNVKKNASRGFGVKHFDINPRATDPRPLKWNASVSHMDGPGTISGKLGIFKRFDLEIEIDAIEKSGEGQTLSKPSVLTLDNVAAILETSKVHYEALSGTNSTNAYSQTASTRMQVVPHIIPGESDENGKRKMKLFVDIAEGDFSVDKSNTVVQHSLNTQAVLFEGQSLMVGGYNAETNKKSDSGVPVLKDLPLVGPLFRHTEFNKEVNERIYVISPTVIEIRSDDHTYDKFVQPGKLDANPTLEPGDYPTTVKWPKNPKEKIRVRRKH
jgi:type III secretion protein C